MKTCYLHLGMPKTGSSSIQDAFQGLETPEIAYAKLPASNHGPLLTQAFSRRAEAQPPTRGWKSIRRGSPAQEARRRIAKALASRKSLVLSGEIMIDRLGPGEFADMVKTLRDHADRVVAIAYVRPLASLAASQFQQRVKTGQRKFVIPAPDYRKRFEKVLSQITPADIVWRRFDRTDLVGGDVVSDFAHVLGLEAPPKIGLSKNEALSAEALAALYAFNRFTAPLLPQKMQANMRARLFDELREVGETKFGLSPELIAQHLERHREDIAWMEETCGFDVKGRITAVPHPVGDQQCLLEFSARVGDESSGKQKRVAV